VKIRGYRVELGEIESVVRESGLVSQAVVVTRDKRLIGYVVASGTLDKAELAAYLEDRLPEYMIPALWVELEALPLTTNGKVDRRALPDPELSGVQRDGYVAPETAVEKMLAVIWEDLLKVARVGIKDNFFELGGDSIITIQVVSRIRQQGYEIRPKDIFLHQNIARLSAAIAERSVGESSSGGEQGMLRGVSGLLPIQQWYLEKGHAGLSHFNQSVLLGIDRGVSIADLDESVRLLSRRHDSLRFVYRREESGWRQEYGSYEGGLIEEDLRSVPAGSLSSAIGSCASRYQRSLDIGKGELMRVVLIHTPQTLDQDRLLLIIHHLAVDGVSWRILLEDLSMLVKGLQSGEEVPAVKSISYRQWYDSLVRYGKSRRLQVQKGYWEEVVRSYVPLPSDKDDEGAMRQSDSRNWVVRMREGRTRQLIQEAPRAYQTEINDLLLCALAMTLSEWSGRDRVVIGLEGHGREELAEGLDTSGTVGWFTSLYPVKLETGVGLGIGDMIKSVKEQLRRIPDRGVGYGVLRYMNREESMQGAHGWDISFNYLGQLDNVLSGKEWLSDAEESSGESISGDYPVGEKLSVNGMVQAGELIMNWSYSSGQYEEESIRKLSERYLELLETLIDHCTDQDGSSGGATPSDYGLSAEISYKELDSFLKRDESNIDNILEF
jgi:non-ribosomal peptide synthase protein (TIGR01720 family)